MKQFNFNPEDFELVRNIALKFPNATDSVSHYDTPSVKIKKNLLCRLHENGEWIAIRTDFESRVNFLEQYPESCFITPHYENYPYICLQVNSYNIDLAKAILESGFLAITAQKSK